MDAYTLRPATAGEVELLAGIKSNYVRSLYRGFLSAEYLREASQAFYIPEITRMMQDANFHLDVLEMDGEAVGFIAYGVDPSAPECGLIREEAIQPEYGRREKDALAQHAIRQLVGMGFGTIHIWVLRDNFRVRYLIESVGFRHDGTARVIPRDGLQLNITRYAYRVPDAGGA